MKWCPRSSHFVRFSILALAHAAFSVHLAAQPSLLPSFEVATVKPALADVVLTEVMDALADNLRFTGGPGSRSSPDRLNYNGVTLKMLVARAYQIQRGQVVGPDWTDSDRWDIVASLPPGTDAEGARLMLQQLLAERFRVQLHRDRKTLPVYRLTVAKKGPKLKPPVEVKTYASEEEQRAAMRKRASESKPPGPSSPPRADGLMSATVGEFAQKLSVYMDRPVKDLTNLAGLYYFRLEWSPRENDNFPTIFDAVETQLGLHLDRGNEPIEVIVIDHAEKTPTEN